MSAVDESEKDALKAALCLLDDPQAPAQRRAACPVSARATEVKFSLGGDKIRTRYDTDPDLEKIKEQIRSVPGDHLRASADQPAGAQPARPPRRDPAPVSKGDQLMDAPAEASSARTPSPTSALRVEWVGPKAGKQLRDSARNAVAIAIVFIMLYLAFRFDLRFAPGVVVACIHDAMVVIGVFIVLHKEITLSTIAAVLTIVGLLDERHGRRLRPHPREPRQAPRQVVRATSST